MAFLIASFMLCQFTYICVATGPDITVDFSKASIGNLKIFWDSTGFCPLGEPSAQEEYILSESELFNLALIGSLPRRAISQVRIHWLLNLITVSFVEDSGVPHYNFTSLDRLLDWLRLFDLYPGFELMGNPSQFFTNLSDDTQVDEWRRLIKLIACRYIERYGLEIVERWRFETWNEPDLKGYNILNFTLHSYLRYFYASVEGLKNAGKGRLHLGGPAGVFKDRNKHPLCWGLLEHCANMIICPLDFISFHNKGGGQGGAILDQDLDLVYNITSMFPSLAAIPFANDESDPLTNWSLNETWRGDVRYGAMVASVITAHQKVMVREHGLPLALLSNDNAFMNYHPFYFSQRTLLARFQINNTNPPHVQFFRKPVYTTMALMSFLGSQEMDVEVTYPDKRLSVLAAEDRSEGAWSSAVLLVWSNETEANPKDLVSMTLHIRNVNCTVTRYVLYLLNNSITNPQEAWFQFGSPVFPNLQQRMEMRSAEGPYRLRGPVDVPSSGNLSIVLHFSLPSVAVLHMCSKSENPPGKVSRLLACNVTFNEVMLFWSEEFVVMRCVKTYEVEFCPNDSEEFFRVNLEDTILLSYQYVVTSDTEQVRGVYRVRVVDYWDRTGPYSSPISYPSNFSCS